MMVPYVATIIALVIFAVKEKMKKKAIKATETAIAITKTTAQTTNKAMI